jgi:hypothetical protein
MLTIKAVRTRTAGIDFMSFFSVTRGGKKRADRDNIRVSWQWQFQIVE